jgi:adenylosuccinate lyase
VIERYTRPAMGALWTDEAKYGAWLEVELAVCEVLGKKGIIPEEDLRTIREKARFDPARIAAIEAEVRHDVVAFTTSVAEHVGEASRSFHYGLTSSDVVDTAQALLIVRAIDLLLHDMEGLLAALKRRALEHKTTPMVGRTHGVHAEPTTFGLKVAGWYAEATRNLDRLAAARVEMRFGKISGAVGTYAHLPPDVEAEALTLLGLQVEPVSTQVIPRDRHAVLMATLGVLASSLDRIALEIRHLQRTEVREAEEPFAKGQKGSSSMPHKRNPVGCENVCGLARIVRSYAQAAFENVALWHERDISHSSAERVMLPDATILCDYMLARLTTIVDGLIVYPEAMAENLRKTKGLVYSQAVLLALARKGLSREKAYAIVQRNSMEVWQGTRWLEDLLAKDPDLIAVLSLDELRACFDPARAGVHVDEVFARVFGASS